MTGVGTIESLSLVDEQSRESTASAKPLLYLLMAHIRRVFVGALGKYPIVTNSIIYGALCCSAELSQQTVTKKILDKSLTKDYDVGAISRFTIYGTTIGGPILTTCIRYRFLDNRVKGSGTKIVVRKILLDQFFFTPQLYVVSVMSVLERKEDIFQECKEKLGKTFLTSCLFWLPAQGINFVFVPSAFRVIYVGLCSFGWLNIISWIKNQ
ncbi:hypothetical protein NQ318_016137 [Aromia moschata]|uniref:Mpv17-like protein n=1 Tax=Aromia moschata TaxID=1265417 RepID=A0AAV8XZJ9_9CUCU|nr:hypothetical protein NQ318_016137 [Aromia moschata]